MKQLLTILLLFGTMVLLQAQCPNLPTQIPSTLAELEIQNEIIGKCYAPTIHQMTNASPNKSLNGRSDLILSVFYDGSDGSTTGDNWNNLVNYSDTEVLTESLDELDPVVYFSVVWLEDYWVITYAFYHARDYTFLGPAGACCADMHENDMEGVILVIDRFNQLVLKSASISHTDLLINNTLGMPDVFIDDGTHAVDVNLSGSQGISNLFNPCDDHLPVSTPHIVYSLSTDDVPSVTANDYSTAFVFPNQSDPYEISVLSGTGLYIIEDIFKPNGLNSYKNNTAVFQNPDQFNQNGSGCEEGNANPPWAWS